MSNRLTYIIAATLLLTLFWTAFSSMVQDSLTFDELAHIPAGYSYLTQKDYRLNPEHPPLIKDLSALPLLFLNLNFPENDQTWLQQEQPPAWWVQFDLGTKFLYQSDNNPQKIIILARLPMILLLLALGLFLFKWARELAGNYAGLGALSIFSLSPNFIAHGRLVTTDVGATFGAVLAAYFWLKFLKNPKKLNVFLAGVFLGTALLVKFSMILLIPFLGIITFVYAIASAQKLLNLKMYLFKAVLAGIIGLLLIWPIYQFHIWKYPIAHQIRDTAADLSGGEISPVKNLILWMSDKPLLRPWAQFFRGVLMAARRTTSGNTVYFLGKISASGWHYYFPIIYLLKVPLAFHILTIAAIIAALILTAKKRLKLGIKKHFTLFSFLVFLSIYWLTAVMGSLNIGVRHLLPVFPFMYLSVILLLKEILNGLSPALKKSFLVFMCLLFGWYAASSISSFPYYLSYFNELAGGTKNGYKYAVDSNYDWGQDFYRLINFIEKNNIKKIRLDYFGGESPKYWLGEKYVKLNPKETAANLSEGLSPNKTGSEAGDWVAVSLNQLMGGIANPVAGFDQPTNYYRWLDDYAIIDRVGNSIFIYYKN